ncbi:sodium:alanine symporter family protein [Cellulophaga sp. Hel_I_12]|uniref:alanine/glycine:cation symporter family protein n=1 Tax=Cellulophaga sp. Hel_I_12 TaxID=1249972 RepID=UPI000B153BE9|nr:alanine/glycine:cation symporter family protein [Cellulophaga sp. Hel_I_12]|tara:strand:- start:1794 stop:3164 length:1371 start_codon:yes stop_codon:yes gene_type:complete
MNNLLQRIEDAIVAFSNWIWDIPLLILLIGGGVYFLMYSRLLPFKHFWYAIEILKGKYDNKNNPGQISAFQALSTALSSTIGMGNIAGVAIAISMGGPGALFWMWISAIIGMTTKYFTCSLAVMYRGKDDSGEMQGGPMYVITEGLGKKWKPLAIFFSMAGLIGSLPIFTANQLTQALNNILLPALGYQESIASSLLLGIIISVFVSMVILGGIKRIASFASKLVPAMVILYFLSVSYILIVNHTAIIPSFYLIFQDAFTGNAVLGGSIGSIIIIGVRRAAFSNEAGIGTAPMAHGASRNQEPVREGLIAMLGPFIDTIVVCTLTALAILVTNSWLQPNMEGVTITLNAFIQTMPRYGSFLLAFIVSIFAFTSLFTYSYYGSKCISFLFGTKFKKSYNYIYIVSIIVGAVSSMTGIVALIDISFALMAIPTMISAIILSPKVMHATKLYFNKLENK